MALLPLDGGDPAQLGAYRLRARLGTGGMGVVYLAYTAPGWPVAVKVIRPELGHDPAFRERFRREVAAARRVSGPFTAQILDADPEAAQPWLVTVYVSGPSLAQAVAVRGPLPALTVLRLARGVAEALAAIHGAGVVHRALKPPNVLLAADGPRVTDFGITGAVEPVPLAQAAVRVVPAEFMAPEQAREEPARPATDVWALGALGCFAATGRAPFGEGDEQAVMNRVLNEQPDLDGCAPEVAAVLAACLNRDPGARPSPAEVSEQCQAAVSAAEADSAAEAGGSWLPPVLAADLAEFAAPPAASWPADPNAAPGPAPFPGPAVSLGPGASPGPAGAPGPAAFPGPAPVPVPAPVPGPGGAATVPIAVDQPGPGWRRLPDRVLAACAAAALVLVAAAGYGVGVLTSRGGGNPGANGAGGPTRNVASPATGPHSPAHRSPAPSPSSALDSCLFGSWKQTLEQVPDTINGNPITLSGGFGMIETFSPGGVSTLQYGSGITWTARVNGNLWSQVDTGSATYNYTTQDGMLLSSDVITHGTQALYENGSYDNGGPLTLNTQPERFTCSGNSLQLFALNGDSEDLTRQ